MMTRHRTVRFDVTARAILKLLGAAILVWLWLRLWQWVLLLVVAVFLAVGLDPLVSWLDRRGLRRPYASTLVVLLIAAGLVGFFYLAGAELVQQVQLLGGQIARVQEDLARRMPSFLMGMLPQGSGTGTQLGDYATRFGRSLLSGITSLGVALVLTVYFLLDGRRTYAWLVAFAPHEQRARVRQTGSEGRRAVGAYMRGNAITSLIAAVSTYIFLLVLGVPAALLLAVLTGLFNFVPVVGLFLSAIPMFLIALTVSIWVAVGTLVFNMLYNMVETYYISPKVYGSQMKLSSLAVVLGFILGAELGGVIGALIALPIVALYPTVEQIWLRERLAPEVLADHRRIEQSEEH